MAHLKPIEVVNNRFSEVELKSGNLIFNTDLQKILYDSSSNVRLDMSSVVVCETEKEIIESTGIPGKIYVAKDNSSLFYYENYKWFAVKIASNAVIYDTFYVSASIGSDENNGLSADLPVKTIRNILEDKGKNLSVLNICIIDGEFAEGDLYIDNKTYINIYSAGMSETAMPYIKSIISINNCTFKLNNLRIGKLIVNNSIGKIYEDIINTTIVGAPDTAISLDNSVVDINTINFIDNYICIAAEKNSICSVTGLVGSSNTVGYKVTTGAVVKIYDNDDLSAGIHHVVENNGRIFLLDEPTDETTKNYIDGKITAANSYVDEKVTAANSYTDKKITETNTALSITEMY